VLWASGILCGVGVLVSLAYSQPIRFAAHLKYDTVWMMYELLTQIVYYLPIFAAATLTVCTTFFSVIRPKTVNV
jgi:hypothetical protein